MKNSALAQLVKINEKLDILKDIYLLLFDH